jgi:flavorubredoxin
MASSSPQHRWGIPPSADAMVLGQPRRGFAPTLPIRPSGQPCPPHSQVIDMSVTSRQTGTNVYEVAEGIFRINTPVEIPGGGGFSFNQYLVVDDEPLLFHTGPRKLFPLVREAVATILPPERLRYIGLSHVEADECGSLNEWLAAAPQSVPLCGRIAAMVSVEDLADRAPRALADGELLHIGAHLLRWHDTPHLPHAWECGLLMEESTGTLLCGDLFTQAGADLPAMSESDILGPSEDFRRSMDYFSHSTQAPALLERLASTRPTTLACMHGSAWRGDGAALLRALAESLVE